MCSNDRVLQHFSLTYSSLTVVSGYTSLWRHHTRVCPTPVIDSTRKPIFSNLSNTRRGGSSTWYSELNEHKHKVILFPTDVGFLCLSLNFCSDGRILLIVLVLVHFLPHLDSFPSSIWFGLPMTTLPWSVSHQIEWFIRKPATQQSPSITVFSSMWPDFSSVVNMYMFTAKKKGPTPNSCGN